MSIKKIGAEIRFLKDIRPVLYDQKWAKAAEDFKAYYIYRGVKRKKGLRYDITIIPSRRLGKEFVRTKGNRNYHGLQELYTVLKGEAVFLLQKSKGRVVEDVFAVKARKGDWLIVPPYYAIITINPAKTDLKTGNWVAEKNKNIYHELEKMAGACYFYTNDGWIKNENYKKIPKLRLEKPLSSMPKNLDLLKRAWWNRRHARFRA